MASETNELGALVREPLPPGQGAPPTWLGSPSLLDPSTEPASLTKDFSSGNRIAPAQNIERSKGKVWKGSFSLRPARSWKTAVHCT